jgi:GNAT superfamily N-acetyltransferase
MAAVVVRPAGPDDAPQVAHFIRELARYERLEDQLDLDEARLRAHLGGPQPACSALLAEADGGAVGFALFFASYSTFRTRPCLYLEDLFVLPPWRGRGIGLALLRAVAAVAVARGCPRLDWSVLDWNAPAIGFYQRQGARLLTDWRLCRLEGEALQRAAAAGRQ